MRFCSIAGLAALAAFQVAAETAAPAGPALVSSVVRADARTGRLVRTVAAPGRAGRNSPAWMEAAASIDRYVHDAAARYGVDPLLVRSVIQVESNYDLFAVSPKGAQGLMQLMPQTARRFEVKNTFDPWENIDGGVRYLKHLLNLFDGAAAPETLALAAYNAGEGAVMKHGGVPPYRETTEYVAKVARKWDQARVAAGPALAAAAPAPEQPPIEQFVDSRGVLHIQTRLAP